MDSPASSPHKVPRVLLSVLKPRDSFTMIFFVLPSGKLERSTAQILREYRQQQGKFALRTWQPVPTTLKNKAIVLNRHNRIRLFYVPQMSECREDYYYVYSWGAPSNPFLITDTCSSWKKMMMLVGRPIILELSSCFTTSLLLCSEKEKGY